MGQTIAEKILSKNNMAGTPAKAGDIVDARIDGIMIEHFQPPGDALHAEENKRTRDGAHRLGAKYFHEACPGLHHQLMVDNGYARPGELILGNDSHTVLYGAINAASTGIGEADLAYATVFGELWFRVPTTVKVVLKGKLPKFPLAKDIAMYLAATFGDDFAQYRAIEFTGPVADEMSLDGRMCLSAQSVEMGAKFGLFNADKKTLDYVKARTDRAFQPVAPDPDAEYERTIEVDVNSIPIMVSKPHRFKNGVPVKEVAGTRLDQACIGSCANGRFEDIAIASRILKGKKVHPRVRFLVAPGSYQVMLQCLEAGVLDDLVRAGAQVLQPGCGICLSHSGYLLGGEVGITTATRNHKGRMGSTDAFVYLGGPATVAASAITGEITDPTEVLREIDAI